jgi:hypothetical protein
MIKRPNRALILTVACLVGLSLIPLGIAYRYPVYLNDDAYITLTYAKNLVHGNGFVFNQPPAVLGTTTPLFTLAVAGLAWLFPLLDIPLIAVFLTAFCWLGIPWILFFFRKEWALANWQVCVVAVVVIGTGWIDILGMEAYVFAFLLILGFSLLFRRHYLSSGVVTGLLFLTRGEGVLVLAVSLIFVGLQQWRQRKCVDAELRQTLVKLGLGFALPLGLWAIYAQMTFGSFLPATLSAKQAQAQTGLWRPFFQRLAREWLPAWGKALALESYPWINAWWGIVILGFSEALLNKRKWLALAGWIGLYITGYSLLRVSAYGWYQFPILFVLHLLFALGLTRIVELLVRSIRNRRLAVGLGVLLVGILVLLSSRPTWEAVQANRGDARGKSYIALSHWLQENTEPAESIAYIEIGYLGYYTENRIIDLAGLVLPEIVPHIADRDFAWGFWRYDPDYYIYLPDFDWALAGIRADPRFDQRYQPVVTLPGPRETEFVVYKRIQR